MASVKWRISTNNGKVLGHYVAKNPNDAIMIGVKDYCNKIGKEPNDLNAFSFIATRGNEKYVMMWG